jgi:hypothetical protein
VPKTIKNWSEGFYKMTVRHKNTPDIFDDHPVDPVEVATGNDSSQDAPADAPAESMPPGKSSVRGQGTQTAAAKKKAGFYISEDILNRFTRKFYELKLAGVPIDNKSTLLELVLGFALDDIDKGAQSRVLKRLNS